MRTSKVGHNFVGETEWLSSRLRYWVGEIDPFLSFQRNMGNLQESISFEFLNCLCCHFNDDKFFDDNNRQSTLR